MAKKKNENIEEIDIQKQTADLANAAVEANNAEQPQPVGSLFGNIQYYNHEDVPNFFEKMTGNDAIFILLSAARFSQTKGIFSLEESEAVSRAVRIVTTPPQSEPQETTEQPA